MRMRALRAYNSSHRLKQTHATRVLLRARIASGLTSIGARCCMFRAPHCVGTALVTSRASAYQRMRRWHRRVSSHRARPAQQPHRTHFTSAPTVRRCAMDCCDASDDAVACHVRQSVVRSVVRSAWLRSTTDDSRPRHCIALHSIGALLCCARMGSFGTTTPSPGADVEVSPVPVQMWEG